MTDHRHTQRAFAVAVMAAAIICLLFYATRGRAPIPTNPPAGPAAVPEGADMPAVRPTRAPVAAEASSTTDEIPAVTPESPEMQEMAQAATPDGDLARLAAQTHDGVLSCHGTVVDGKGRKLARVPVFLQPAYGAAWQAVSDARGRFSIPIQDLAAIARGGILWAEHPSLVSTRLTVIRLDTAHTLVMNQGELLSLRVVDEDDVPLPDVKVSLQADPDMLLALNLVGHTDTGGALDVPAFPAQGIVQCEKEGYVTARVGTLYPDEVLVVVLQRRRYLKGNLIDADSGRALQDVAVALTMHLPAGKSRRERRFSDTFEWVVPAEGRYDLSFVKQGYETLALKDLAPDTPLEAALTPSDLGLDLMLLDAAGAPLPGIEVVLLAADLATYAQEGNRLWQCAVEDKACPTGPRYTARSDGEGRVTLDHIAPASAFILLAYGTSVGRTVRTLPADWLDAQAHDLVLPRAAAAYGTVDPVDFPDASQVILVSQATPLTTRSTTWHTEATPDASRTMVSTAFDPNRLGDRVAHPSPEKDGAFRFEQLAPGTYTARLKTRDLPVAVTVTLVEGEQTEIVFPPSTLAVEGRVTFEGRPRGGVQVLLGMRLTETDVDGGFRFADVQPGTHRGRLFDGPLPPDAVVTTPAGITVLQDLPRFFAWHASGFEVTVADHSAWVDADLELPGDLTGSVAVDPRESFWAEGLGRRMYAKPVAGQFRLAQLPAGAYYLFAQTGNESPRVVSRRIDKGPGPLALGLLPALETGSLKLETDSRCAVQLRDPETGHVVAAAARQSPGVLSLAHVPVGTWLLVHTDPAHTDAPPPTLVLVEADRLTVLR